MYGKVTNSATATAADYQQITGNKIPASCFLSAGFEQWHLPSAMSDEAALAVMEFQGRAMALAEGDHSSNITGVRSVT